MVVEKKIKRKKEGKEKNLSRVQKKKASSEFEKSNGIPFNHNNKIRA